MSTFDARSDGHPKEGEQVKGDQFLVQFQPPGRMQHDIMPVGIQGTDWMVFRGKKCHLAVLPYANGSFYAQTVWPSEICEANR